MSKPSSPGKPSVFVGVWLRVQASGTVFAADVGHGLLEVSHNTLALVGLLIVGHGGLSPPVIPMRAMPSRRRR